MLEPLSQFVFNIYGFTQDPNIIYVASNHEGGTTGIYVYDQSTDQYIRKIYKNPEVDIFAVIWNVSHTRIVKVFYILDNAQAYWLDPVEKAAFNTLHAVLPILVMYAISVVPTAAMQR